MLLEGAEGADVEGGNRFAESTLDGELEDIIRVSAAFFDRPLTFETLVDELNVEPQQGPAGADEIWAIDWGTWAAMAQRHLLMEVNAWTRTSRTSSRCADAARTSGTAPVT